MYGEQPKQKCVNLQKNNVRKICAWRSSEMQDFHAKCVKLGTSGSSLVMTHASAIFALWKQNKTHIWLYFLIIAVVLNTHWKIGTRENVQIIEKSS